ncbi:MAG: STAS domain-containing protein [Bryobacteraceae bacterium]|nr:STAS domain-containing protein [Bryobacteraceae bacterium]
MAFQLTTREVDGVLILEPAGKLVAGENLEEFREAIDSAFNAGRQLLVVDMTGVSYMDSSALGCLVVTHTRVQKAGGAMALFGLSLRNLELMLLTKLSTVFRLHESEIDAVNSVIPGREAPRFDILEFVQRQRAERSPG